ncbi:MAG TPA: efflux RND transporter permease subunit [Xanthomonadaceae bacterium]|nr:efflux RND transporter permease subunit [Xanthomonadaceae bacterium]
MNIAEFSLRRPVTAFMLFVSMMAIGLIAAFRLPLEFFPSVDAPFLFVQVPYPGSTPEEVEQQITRPVEEVLATLSGIERINSNSMADNANVFIMFKWGTDIGVRAVEARDRLDAARSSLPTDVRRINLFKWNTSDAPVLNIRISSRTQDLDNAYDLLEQNLKRPVERIPGVARVMLHGVEPREVQIELSADRLSAHGVSLNELAVRLQQANFASSAGLISDGPTRWRVQPVGELRSLDEVRALPIGGPGLRLGDVAEVTLKSRVRDYERRLEGRYAIGLEVFKESDANLVEVGFAVLAEVERIGKLPEFDGIDLMFFDNQAEGVTSSLAELARAGLIGLLLALVVLYMFLRHWPSTLMVALAIPVCMVITLGFMYFFGISLNILSMMGLLLGVGMLVDNAVVVTESIYQVREKHPDRPAWSAVTGARAVTLAISAGTLTSIVVFAPNIFGEKNFLTIYLSQVAITITIALLASWLVAVSLIPLISSRIKSPPRPKSGGFSERFRNAYARMLDWTLGHRGWVMLGIVALVVVSMVVPMAGTKKDMFPPDQQRTLRLDYTLNANYLLPELRESVKQVEAYLEANRERFEIETIYSYFNETGGAFTQMVLIPQERARKASSLIIEEVREGLPKIAVGEVGFRQMRMGASEGLVVSIIGDSTSTLAELERPVMEALNSVPGLRDVRSELGRGAGEMRVRVDRDRAAQYGFSAEEVGRYVGIALRGLQLREYRGAEGEVPMWVRFQDSDRQSTASLGDFKIQNSAGEQIPLLALVDIDSVPGPRSIQRQQRQTGLRFNANLAEGSTMPDVRKAIETRMNALSLPPGYRWSFGGGFSDADTAGEQMMFNTLIAVLLIFIVMAAVFESLLYPLAIVTAIGFSILGVFWFFFLTGTTFSLMASIGILILIGVVVNNGIVLVEHVNNLRHQGLSRHDALVQGCRDRLRPILMTVATTVLGMLPLAISGTQLGGGGPPYFPMARAIIGGLIFSTVISLVVLPTLYTVLDDMRLATGRIIRDARAGRLRPQSAG